MRRQHEAARRTMAEQEGRNDEQRAARVSTQLTDAQHVGKIAAEPDLGEKEIKNAAGEEHRADGVTHVETVPIETDGKVTGHAVVNPPAAQIAPEPQPNPNDKIKDAVKGHKRARGGKRAK